MRKTSISKVGSTSLERKKTVMNAPGFQKSPTSISKRSTLKENVPVLKNSPSKETPNKSTKTIIIEEDEG